MTEDLESAMRGDSAREMWKITLRFGPAREQARSAGAEWRLVAQVMLRFVVAVSVVLPLVPVTVSE